MDIKQNMSLKEFSEYSGLPYSRVKELVHIPRQTFAYKLPAGSKWYINISKFDKWQDMQIAKSR